MKRKMILTSVASIALLAAGSTNGQTARPVIGRPVVTVAPADPVVTAPAAPAVVPIVTPAVIADPTINSVATFDPFSPLTNLIAVPAIPVVTTVDPTAASGAVDGGAVPDLVRPPLRPIPRSSYRPMGQGVFFF